MANATVTATKVRPLLPSHTVKGTAGEAMTVGNVVHKVSDGQWEIAQADSWANARALIGIAVAGIKGDDAGAIVANETIDVLVWGRCAGFSDLDEEKGYWLSATAGKLADTIPGNNKRLLGYPDTDEVFFFHPESNPTS